jgi:hypothetical protein
VTLDPPQTPPGSACVIYYRVSTDKQEPDSQREDVERYVTARGWRVSRVYEERMSGVSRDMRKRGNCDRVDAVRWPSQGLFGVPSRRSGD